MVSSEGQASGGLPPPSGGFEESLAYLLVFSEALLDLVPDPVGVLDSALRVRNANEAFARAFGFPSATAIRHASLADHALLRAAYGEGSQTSLAEALRKLCDGTEGTLEVSRVETVGPDGAKSAWKLRASGWDTEDPSFRRVLIWCHPLEALASPAPPVEPAPSSPAPPEPPTPVGGESQDRLLEALLERMPHGACVLDPKLRVRAVNRRLLALFGRSLDRDELMDRHLFSVFPELRDAEFLPLLETCRDEGSPVAGTLTVTRNDGGPSQFEIEVQPIGVPVDEQWEVLLLFHEDEGMIPTLTTTDTQTGVPETPEAIVDPARLARWPASSTDRVLLVEADSWARMTLADSLRNVGLTDLGICDSGAEAWARHDPAFFALTIVGVDASPDDAQEFCARMAREAAGVPVLALTEGSIERARALVGGFPLVGILALSSRSPELGSVALAIARRTSTAFGSAPGAPAISTPPPTAEPAALAPSTAEILAAASDVAPTPAPASPPFATSTPPAIPEPVPPVQTVAPRPPLTPPAPTTSSQRIDVVLLGARESEVSALNLLYKNAAIRVRLVYDSQPDAIGLAVAQRLGVPSISGEATFALDPPPSAVVVARKGLESALARLQLSGVPCIERDEIELFAADPEAFLPKQSPPPPAPPKMTAPPRDPAPPAPVVIEAPSARPAEGLSPPPLPVTPGAPELWAAPEPAPTPRPAREPEPSFFHTIPEPPPRAEQPAAAFPPPPEMQPPAPPSAPSTEWHVSASEQNIVGGLDLPALTGAFDLLFDFDRLCRRVLDLAIASVNGASGSLMLLGEDGRTLRIEAAVGLSDLVVRETRQRVGEGIAGRVADDAEPLLLVGTIGDERFPVRGERPEIPSAVCVPIMAEGRVLGVMNVNSVPTNDPFDQPEVQRLASFARQVGPALDRSRQLRQVRGRSFELSVRGAIESIATSGEDLVTRLRRVAARAVELLNVDACAIWLHEPKTERLVLRALSGSSAATMDALSTPIGVGTVGWVAKNRRPLVLRHSPDDPTDLGALHVASAAVPIRHHTDLVGVLTVESTAGALMDPNRLALLSTVAGVIGEQVGASRAQASSEHMVTMLSALSELGVAFGAARERRGLARLVAFTAATVLESDVATVRILRDEVPPGASDAEAYELLASHGASPTSADDPLAELEGRVAREVITRRAGVTDVELPVREASQLLTRSNVASFLGIPMMSDEAEILGVVVVYRVADARGREIPYGEPEREIAARLSDYAASAALRFSRGGSSRESDQ